MNMEFCVVVAVVGVSTEFGFMHFEPVDVMMNCGFKHVTKHAQLHITKMTTYLSIVANYLLVVPLTYAIEFVCWST